MPTTTSEHGPRSLGVILPQLQGQEVKERRKSRKPKMRWCQGLILTVITLQAGGLLSVVDAGEARRNEEDEERLREVGVSMQMPHYVFIYYDF